MNSNVTWRFLFVAALIQVLSPLLISFTFGIEDTEAIFATLFGSVQSRPALFLILLAVRFVQCSVFLLLVYRFNQVGKRPGIAACCGFVLCVVGLSFVGSLVSGDYDTHPFDGEIFGESSFTWSDLYNQILHSLAAVAIAGCTPTFGGTWILCDMVGFLVVNLALSGSLPRPDVMTPLVRRIFIVGRRSFIIALIAWVMNQISLAVEVVEVAMWDLLAGGVILAWGVPFLDSGIARPYGKIFAAAVILSGLAIAGAAHFGHVLGLPSILAALTGVAALSLIVKARLPKFWSIE